MPSQPTSSTYFVCEKKNWFFPFLHSHLMLLTQSLFLITILGNSWLAIYWIFTIWCGSFIVAWHDRLVKRTTHQNLYELILIPISTLKRLSYSNAEKSMNNWFSNSYQCVLLKSYSHSFLSSYDFVASNWLIRIPFNGKKKKQLGDVEWVDGHRWMDKWMDETTIQLENFIVS